MSVDPYPGLEVAQPYDATLSALADLVTSANTAPYFTDIDQAALMTVTPFARSILDDTDAASLKATLEFGSGVANRVALWLDTDTLTSDGELYYDPTTNRLGIGLTTPGYTLDVAYAYSLSGQGGTFHTARFAQNITLDFNSSAGAYVVQAEPTINQSYNTLTNTVAGFHAVVTTTGTSGVVESLMGFRTFFNKQSTGQVTTIYGFLNQSPTLVTTGYVTAYQGFTQRDVSTGAQVVQAFKGEVTSGTNRYNVYCDGTAQNYFAGNVGIGTTTPSAPLTFANTFGRKINLYSAGAFHHGLEVQGGALLVFADSTAQVRLGNMAADGTTFTPRFDVLPTYAYSSVPLAVMWGTVANYDLTTNRLYAAGVSQISTLGINVVPSYTFHVNGDAYFSAHAGFGTAPEPGIAHLTANMAKVTGSLSVYGNGLYVNAGALDVTPISIFRNLVGINYAPDPGYWLRCPSALFDSLTVSGIVIMNDFQVTTGGYIGGNVGIQRAAMSGGWSLALNYLYADNEVQANYLNSRGNVYAANDVSCNYLYVRTNVQGNLRCSNTYLLDGYTDGGGGFLYRQMIQANPAWSACTLNAVHVSGSWAGFRMQANGPYADINLSGGGASLSNGAWVDAPSDRRIKRDIVAIDTPLERLAKLHGSHYERTDTIQMDGFVPVNSYEYGLIAQDVAEALPDAAFEYDYGPAHGKLWNYYDRPILALLVESVKALAQRLDTLEQKG